MRLELILFKGVTKKCETSKRILSIGFTANKHFHRLSTTELKTVEKIKGLVRYSPLLFIIISSHIAS